MPQKDDQPSAVSTENDDEDFLNELGFMFESNRSTSSSRFDWILQSSKRAISVTLESIDEEPGAVQSGHYLWPAAQLLVNYITSHTIHEVPIASMIELGAGCGLASLAALQIWQESLECCVVTDHDPSVLARARSNYESTLQAIMDASQTEEQLNAAINDIASIPMVFEDLEWGGVDGTLPAVKKALLEHTTEHVDTADLVLGTDIIYCPSVVEPLFRTVAELLKRPTPLLPDANGKVVVATLPTPTTGPGFHGGRFYLSQSFRYDDETEAKIDAMCDELGLTRVVLLDEQGERRVQEFKWAS